MTKIPMDLASRTYLFLDCQTTGLKRDQAEVLELGWSFSFEESEVETRLVKPTEVEAVSKVVWRMTGISPDALSDAADAVTAWREVVALARARGNIDCAVIHYSQFELPFLESLHRKAFGDEPFPWPIVCTYKLAKRLDADLPARTLRALSGHLGFDLPEEHRSRGHVIATQKIWRHQIELLKTREAVQDWSSFQSWLEAKPVNRKAAKVKKRFLAPKEARADLPDRPGVYEMLSRTGNVLYVGKATSLKSRVATYFQQRRPERARLNELMTQVADVRVTETATPLEAALLENDRIKELEPPYNQLLRSFERQPFYVGHDGISHSPTRSAEFPWGPFTTMGPFESLHRLLRLHQGEPTEEDLIYLNHPKEEVQAKFRELLAKRSVPEGTVLRCKDLIRLGKKIKGPAPEDEIEASLHRKLRRMGRSLHQAFWRRKLMDCRICWRVSEDKEQGFRAIEFQGGKQVKGFYLSGPEQLARPGEAREPSRERVEVVGIEMYDHMRILFTELGILAKRVPVHIRFSSTRIYRLLPEHFSEPSA